MPNLYKVNYKMKYVAEHKSKFIPQQLGNFLYGKPYTNEVVYSKLVYEYNDNRISETIVELKNKYGNEVPLNIQSIEDFKGYNHCYVVDIDITTNKIEEKDWPEIQILKDELNAKDYLMLCKDNFDFSLDVLI